MFLDVGGIRNVARFPVYFCFLPSVCFVSLALFVPLHRLWCLQLFCPTSNKDVTNKKEPHVKNMLSTRDDLCQPVTYPLSLRLAFVLACWNAPRDGHVTITRDHPFVAPPLCDYEVEPWNGVLPFGG